jgi:hypothetical protein
MLHEAAVSWFWDKVVASNKLQCVEKLTFQSAVA